MQFIKKGPINRLGYNFIPSQYLSDDKDEYYIRNKQNKTQHEYRALSAHEVEILVKNSNFAQNWNDILVTDPFEPSLVKNNRFYGLNRIGKLENFYLEFHDFRHPVGIYNSTLISCDIGSNCVISNVQYLANYIIDEECVLKNINEMLTSNYAKFGNGILKHGENEHTRIWLELCNENGGRKVIPFDGMLSQDAYIWSKYRDDSILMNKLKDITETQFDSSRGYYGTVGARSIIKNCRVIKDVKIETDAYIKGANKLKNLTIHSSQDAGTQIGEGVELVNGIIGYGCRIFYGTKAVRFIMGDNSSLKYGARLINSFLGENSTISCCEVLNSLIFPGHEQHHNNSFLCAALIKGQSNIAAGATIGSNHNSRGNDGELIAGRGFWPGLCTSLKHNSRFASFTLLVKGSYPAELDIPFPFSLVSTNDSELVIIPAYWFLYNMYALARNESKYNKRDNRWDKSIQFEFDFLAPDTVIEMITSCRMLEDLVIKNSPDSISREKAETLLMENDTLEFDILADNIENSHRPVKIIKICAAYREYQKMITLYGILGYSQDDNTNKKEAIDLDSWVNIGTQLVTKQSLDSLIRSIKTGKLSTWDSIHKQYQLISDTYKQYKIYHGTQIINKVLSENKNKTLNDLISTALQAIEDINQKTVSTREKDYINHFRKMTYANQDEMDTVVGKLEDNSSIKEIHKTTSEWKEMILKLL